MYTSSLTAHEIHKLLINKEIKCEELVKTYIDSVENQDAVIGAFLEKDYEKALCRAREVDGKIDKGESIGDLEGVPCGIKDNICTLGIKTTCASKILDNFVPPYNATVAEKLQKDGAIMLGKTNMDEFAMGSSNENSAFKKVKNPWDIERVPGGSSGGSAAAVASGEAVFSLGSDTGGSVRQPASFCGVMGIKPTYGLIAFGSSLDQIGAFTKDAEDMASVLNSITGYDEKDSTSCKSERIDYKLALDENIKGMRIGVPKEYFGEGISDDTRKCVMEAIDTCRRMGAEIIELSLPYTEYALSVYYILSSAEASSNLARFDGIRYGHRSKNFENAVDIYVKSRSEGFGDEVKRRIMLGTYVLSAGYYDAYYNKALKVRMLVKRDFEEAFKKCDVLVSPTSPTTAFKIGDKIDDPLSMYMSDICTVPVNIAGICAMSIPCGISQNLPVGLQLIGNYFNESKLIKLSYAYQKNTSWHKMKPRREDK